MELIRRWLARHASGEKPPLEIRQIYYSDESAKNVDPAFIALDNRQNLRPDWREYFPIRQFLLERLETLHEHGHYGFFSHKFRIKTFLDAATVFDFIERDRKTDVILFSPGCDLQGLFLNTFHQGEYIHPGLMACATRFCDDVGLSVDLRHLVMDASNSVFGNYFVAKPAFWREWLRLNEKLYAFAEKPSPLYEELGRQANYEDVQLKVFLMERMASLLLASDVHWTTRAYDPFKISVSILEPFCRNVKTAVLCDALKSAYRRQPLPTYLKTFYQLLAEHAIPQPQLDAQLEPPRDEESYSDAEIAFEHGRTQLRLRQFESAVASFDRAIAADPRHARAHNNRGVALLELGTLDAAISSFDRAIALQPGLGAAWNNRGNALLRKGQAVQAIQSYENALKVSPDYPFTRGSLLNSKMDACDWQRLGEHVDEIASRLWRGETASPPFPLLSMVDDPKLHGRAASLEIEALFPPSEALGPIIRTSKDDMIRVGYFSADFRNHAVANLAAGLFETHDKEHFEIVAFSFGPDVDDTMRDRVRAACDQFIDISGQSDLEAARLSRDMDIDIAIDLGGHTKDARTGIFALRAAPIQASYLGYLGTMGADYYDYLIADKTIIPIASQEHYREKIVYLPSFQINDSKRSASDRVFLREELGLPLAGFVFGCFNNAYKITPSIYAAWMRILQRVPGSVLMLYAGNDAAQRNLRMEAERRGVAPQRILFAALLPLPDYLARMRNVDLFLDTFPYNAGTVASDALWMGLPVLTLAGQSFASRMGASLLHALEVPELVTTMPEEYEARAVELATHPERLAQLKAKLQANRATTALFDTPRFTRNLEKAYRMMIERLKNGLGLANLAVE